MNDDDSYSQLQEVDRPETGFRFSATYRFTKPLLHERDVVDDVEIDFPCDTEGRIQTRITASIRVDSRV